MKTSLHSIVGYTHHLLKEVVRLNIILTFGSFILSVSKCQLRMSIEKFTFLSYQVIKSCLKNGVRWRWKTGYGLEIHNNKKISNRFV